MLFMQLSGGTSLRDICNGLKSVAGNLNHLGMGMGMGPSKSTLSLFNWAKFRTTKGTVKLHTVLDHDSALPNYACLSDGKNHEINIARQQHFPKGSVVIVDRGCVDC